jgi:D-sedoheptulose 7-phosphate isomerase
MNYIQSHLAELQGVLDRLPLSEIDQTVRLLHEARRSRRQVFIMGNGGSASTASHFVCDLAKNTRVRGWPSFRVIGLSDNVPLLTAYANDEGYEQVFAAQLTNLLQRGDIVIAISASGNSPNVVRAIEAANAEGATTIGWTGFTGGRLGSLVHLHLHVPSSRIELVEDLHLVLEHLVCRALRERAEAMDPAQEQVDGAAAEGLAREIAMPGISRPWAGMLGQLGRELLEPPDLSSLLQRALLLTVENVGALSGSLIVLDEHGNLVDGAVAYAGELRPATRHQLADTLRRGLAGWVFRNGHPALVEDTHRDPRWLPSEWDDPKTSPRSAISVPLMAGEHVIGVLTLVNPDARRFTERDLAMLGALASGISVSAGEALTPERRKDGGERALVGVAPASSVPTGWPRTKEPAQEEGQP